jgi:peptide/nickel transport system permease protein
MRWLIRRLGFYVFAIWVSLTISFLLPRLMPGDPLGGLLQHLSSAQIAANPGIIQTYQALLGGGHNSIWQDYVTYMHRIANFDFGISTSNYPTPVSEVVGRTLPYSIFLVGVAFILAFIVGTLVGMLAAWTSWGSGRTGSRSSTPTPTTPYRVSTGPSSAARSATRSCPSSRSSPPTRAAGC